MYITVYIGTFITEGQFEWIQKLWLTFSFLEYTDFITLLVFWPQVLMYKKLDNNLIFPPDNTCGLFA